MQFRWLDPNLEASRSSDHFLGLKRDIAIYSGVEEVISASERTSSWRLPHDVIEV
jgi:hypothetical protein